MKTKIIVALCVALLVVAISFAIKGAVDMLSTPPKAVSIKAPVTVPSGNKAPTEEFLIDYANFKELQKQVRELEVPNKKLIEKRRLLQGTIDELNAQVPPGYTWDDDTKSFKPRQLPPPVPQPETKKP